ncbi:hypothetical protein ANCCAN_20052 [Ancylostoma caninum]|uniref:Uncharacterized protein n=1 Tax=Ancylostoma caninum TaxID=29170 RepID=A0A368FPW3_ANCCA|nr:hypothetical protein ANCCAN_20052 [Ancylostoma caninum]
MEPKVVVEAEPQEDTLNETSEISQEISIPNGCFLQDHNSVSTEATALEEVKEIAACSSMDPITRDVERRMSMKREISHAEETMRCFFRRSLLFFLERG